MRTWAIYYADRSSFGSDDGAWDDAPRDGVICVVRRDGERIEWHSGADYYRLFEDGSVGASSDHNAWMRTAIRAGEIKFGLYVSNGRHEEIMARARAEWR